MKVELVEAPGDDDKPAVKIIANSTEEQNILWCLFKLGPETWRMVEEAENGGAKVASIIFEDAAAGGD